MRMNKSIRLSAILTALLAAPAVFALQTDRSQPLNVDADQWRTSQSVAGNANKADITHLDGNVVMTQGSMKARADHATIYRNPSGVVDASGNAGSLTRVVMTGAPAHMQQVHDGDCLLMSAQAATIDYHNDTGIAVLTGQVVVVQHGKGTFRSEHMVYNTNSGELEGGDSSASSRVHMVIEPKNQPTAAPPTSNNCGYSGAAKTPAQATPDGSH